MTTATLQSRLAAVQNAGRFDDVVIGGFARYIAEAPDEKLFRMNPYRYAAETGIGEREAVDLFLHAAHAGVVEFSWGVLCPACGSFITTDHALRALNKERMCAICDISIPPEIDDNVEVAFSVAPSARTIRFHAPEKLDFLRDSFALFFSPSVADPTHLGRYLENPVWFDTAPAGATVDAEQELTPGRYVLALPEYHVLRRFTVDEGGGGSALSYEVLAGGQLIQDGEQLAAGKVRMTLQNRLGRPVVFGAFADPRPSSPEALAEKVAKLARGSGLNFHRFFTVKELVTTQVFRDLFRAESIPSQGGLGLKNLTVLFTDLKGSTELYSRMGDMRAYGLVGEHFGLLREVVAARGGAVVKTIGDAVMASFPTPAPALEAAMVMNREIAKVGELELKIGLHAGPCIAVDLNERLDYFGQTVNIAARVQGIADSRQIVCTDAVRDAPGAAEVIAGLSLVSARELAALKGVAGQVGVWRYQ
jgi:class 3 adenylate cyclase